MHAPRHGTSATAGHGSPKPTANPGASRDLGRWLPLVFIGAAQFMLVIDVTVVNVALPSIGQSLGLDRAGLTWVAIAYTLFFGSLLMLGGRLADTFGRRRLFLAGLGIFTVALGVNRLVPTFKGVRGNGIDLPAVLLIAPAIAFVLYALIGAGDAGWI